MFREFRIQGSALPVSLLQTYGFARGLIAEAERDARAFEEKEQKVADGAPFRWKALVGGFGRGRCKCGHKSFCIRSGDTRSN